MTEDFIPTKGSRKQAKGIVDYQSVTFESYKAKKRDETKGETEDHKPVNVDLFNIKKSRHEVVKFGMSGFDPQKKEEAKIQLAIKLGAKPPKNKYKNYRLVKEERAKQKEEDKRKSQFQQLGKNALGKSTAKRKGYDRKMKKAKGGILDVYGKVTTLNK